LQVNTFENFDSLLIKENHPSRSPSDTYYVNEDKLLRTHTSAHENSCLSLFDSFCVFGDVYRRDEIDATHYPVFHQMEAVRLYKREDLTKQFSTQNDLELIEIVTKDLKETMENAIRNLLKTDDLEMRWNSDYFPFTEPSFELEVLINGKWLEVLGCGSFYY
jgi:phenylalanyl-tRNA synthetase alpha chain